MNHLEEAKKSIEKADVAEDIQSCQYHMDDAKTYALIAIAEQLEKIVKGIELPRIVIEIPED